MSTPAIFLFGYLLAIFGVMTFWSAYMLREATRQTKKGTTTTDHLYQYILFRGFSVKETVLPTDKITIDWMRSHGIRPIDRDTLIYKYVEKGLNAEKNEDH